MGRILAAGIAALLVATSGLALVSVVTEPSVPPDMNLWEAYSRGLVTITQVDVTFDPGGGPTTAAVGFKVSSTAAVDIHIDELAMLMSPNPLAPGDPATTTQDGVLTATTIAAGGTVTFGFGDLVAQGALSGPTWWCTEERQFILAEVQVVLGGEILPFAMAPILGTVTANPGGTQDDVWNDLKLQASPVIGKTVGGAFWSEIPDSAGQRLDVALRATNLAIRDDDDGITGDPDAPTAGVWDTVPAGFTVDPGSIIPTATVTTNEDGSTTLTWITDLPAADVTGHEPDFAPTPYVSRTFSYTMTTPGLAPGRLVLPRALVSAGDDRIAEAHSAQPLLDVLSVNDPPVAHVGGPYAGNEGDTIAVTAAASTDADGDPLTYRWDLDADGVWDTEASENPTASFTYGDDFVGTILVEVSDGELTDTAEASVTITNVDPALDDVSALLSGSLTLRAAGEKWHELTMEVTNGDTTYVAMVVREPGSPDEQSATLANLELDVLDGLGITVTYTPEDDPVNGNVRGANPAWVIFTAPDGQEIIFHHTFNVRHPDTWIWNLDDVLAQVPVTALSVRVAASDVGSDDLAFSVAWGDGTSSSITVFNDGVGPDPDPSIDMNPISTVVEFSAPYAEPGTYTVTVLVWDDDGGSASATFTWSVGG